jgi:hypothetical protein
MAKGLAHRQLVEDSTLCDVASADYLLMFRKRGENPVPVAHPTGLTSYAGAREVPGRPAPKYRGWKGKQTENRYSPLDLAAVRLVRSGTTSGSTGCCRTRRPRPDDEKHVHPLQLDVIERAVVLWSNPGEVGADPVHGRRERGVRGGAQRPAGVGVELKPAYYRQART